MAITAALVFILLLGLLTLFRADNPKHALMLLAHPNTNITLSAFQLEAREELLKLSPRLHEFGATNNRLFTVRNTSGRHSFAMHAYNPTLPFYWLEVQRGGKWELIPMVISSRPDIEIAPKSSLTFSAVVPAGVVYRIRLRGDLQQSQPSPALSWIKSFLRLPSADKSNAPEMFWVASPEISPQH